MGIDLLIKLAGLGIIVAVLNIFLVQAKREEWAYVLGLAGIIIGLLTIIPHIARLFQQVQTVFGLS